MADFVKASDAVVDMAEHIIDEHRPDLKSANIAFMFRLGDPPNSRGKEMWARAEKVTGKWNDMLRAYADVDFDFLIWIVKDKWRDHPDKRRPLMHHELCHCTMEWSESVDDYVPKIQPHDVEEFDVILELYGAWHPGLAHAAKVFNQEPLPHMDGDVMAVGPEDETEPEPVHA